MERAQRISQRVTAIAVVMLALSACGSSGTSTAKGPGSSSTTGAHAVVKTLGNGVTASSIKIGIALVDFSQIVRFTDVIRTDAEQKQIYQLFIDHINANGGINGRKIVPVYKYYSPLGNTQILTDCTSFTQDDNVFAVIGTFVDFAGDAQTCIAKQERRVLMTFNLTEAIIDKSPPGLIVTPGAIPERSASILISLLKQQKTLVGKTVGVLGDTTESSVVNGTIVPGLKRAGATLGATALLSVGVSGDTTAALNQLDSYIERWKTQHVDTLFLSGDLASTKQFVQKVKQAFPDMLLLADNNDVIDQAQQMQQSGVKPNPYEGVIGAGGLSPSEYDDSSNWKYCASIYKAATGKPAPDAEHTIKLPNGKIDGTFGVITDACQLLTMFHDIAERAGPYLNDTNWINTVDHFGSIENRGTGSYSSLHTGKYSADDTWRLQKYDSSLGDTGLWKPLTPIADIAGT